jgi:predicted PurR-regulated permease PerM
MPFPPPTEKQARTLWISATTVAVGVLLAMICVFVWGLGKVLQVLSPVLWPLAIAGILAYLLDPVVDFFERRRVSRQRAIILVFSLCAVAFVAVLASVVPRLIRETEKLIADIPAYSRDLQNDLVTWVSRRPVFDVWRERFFPSRTAATNVITTETNAPALTNDLTVATTTNKVSPEAIKTRENAWAVKISESVLSWLGAMLPKLGSWLLAQMSRVASWAGTIIGLALVPVFAYYFLQEKTGIQKGWTNYLPLHESRLKDELVFVLNSINNYLIVFFRGQVLIALCDAVMLVIGFLSIGLNYAVLFGLLAGLLSMVPYLGTIVTIIPTTILAAVQFRDLFHPVMVVAIFGMVHVIEGFVVAPKIMGDRVGLHPLTIIVAVLVGTTLLGGILGGILAIPVTAALRVVMFRYVWKKRDSAIAAE